MRRTRSMAIPSALQRSASRHSRARARAVAAATRPSWLKPVIWTVACAASALAMAALAPKANAQVFSSTPYVAAPDPAVEQLRLRLEALESDLRAAIGQTETLGAQLADARRVAEQADAGRRRAEAEIETLKDRVETLEEMLSDPNQRAAVTARPTSAAASSGAAVAPALAAAPFDTAMLPQDEEGLFSESQALLIGGDFVSAEHAFNHFLSKYPKGKKTADAQYYLGESLLYQDNYVDAAAAYGKLIKDHPNSSNAPNGLVKLARALRLMDKRSDACRTLGLMDKQFPKAPAVAKQMAAQEKQYAKC